MAVLLKQSTAATIKMGPFVDDTDGKTAETGLTISQADIRLSKNGGAFAQTNNSAGATHDENGYYVVPLDTTATGTLGYLRVAISESGALPVVQDFMVVPVNVYDSLVGGSDSLEVDMKAISGDTTAADNLELLTEHAIGTDNKLLLSTDAQDLSESLDVNTKTISGSATAANNIEVVFDTDFATNYDATNDRWKVDIVALDSNATALDNLVLSAGQIIAGTVDGAGSATVFEADDITEATADHYVGRVVIFTSGALAGQASAITSYQKVGANGEFTVNEMTDSPANDDTFIVV